MIKVICLCFFGLTGKFSAGAGQTGKARVRTALKKAKKLSR